MANAFFPSADTVLRIDDEGVAEVLDTLSTDSARRILAALNDGPATAPELAEQTDLTAQNVSYHLGKLTAADLVRTEGTRGTGGTEATVYAPAKSVVVSTETSRERRLSTGIIGLVVGVLLSLACLHSVLEPALAVL